MFDSLPPHVLNQVRAGIPGIDIMHGVLKSDLVEAEQNLDEAQKAEDESGEATDSMERTYAEGYLEALLYVYKMTYDLSFAISDQSV